MRQDGRIESKVRRQQRTRAKRGFDRLKQFPSRPPLLLTIIDALFQWIHLQPDLLGRVMDADARRRIEEWTKTIGIQCGDGGGVTECQNNPDFVLSHHGDGEAPEAASWQEDGYAEEDLKNKYMHGRRGSAPIRARQEEAKEEDAREARESPHLH